MAQPMTFLQAAAFQWVNPKAWVLALTAFALYSVPNAPYVSLGLIVLMFVLVVPPCTALWTGFGLTLKTFLSEPRRLKWFNVAMGIALAATLWPMLAPS